MLKVTYLDFRGASAGGDLSGWYITDANGALIGDAHRYDDLASGLRALSALSG